VSTVLFESPLSDPDALVVFGDTAPRGARTTLGAL